MFGCDVCQRVCPWNKRFAAPPVPAAWPRRPDLERLTARNVLEAEGPALHAWMRGSPLERPHRGGLLRNAAVVAGNSGDPSLAAPLARRLASDADPNVRAHAAWALGRLGGEQAHAALEASQATEQELDVLQEILRALQGIGA